MELKFEAYNIEPSFLRTDKSQRISMDLSQDQVMNAKEIFLRQLPEGLYQITIKSVENDG
jgi:hypothetical protein